MILFCYAYLKTSKKQNDVFDWGQESELAEKDIREGKVKRFKGKNEAVKWLKS